MSLRIEGIIDGAGKIRDKIAHELPSHAGLASAVEEVIQAANEAKKTAQRGKNFFSLSRLPAAFLALAVLSFLAWAYWNFYYSAKISVALPDRDFTNENVRYFRKGGMRPQKVDSSAEAIQRVAYGKSDIAFVQAGIPVPDELTVLQTPLLENVVWMTRKDFPVDREITSVLTNAEGEGSHHVARDFFRRWTPGRSIEYRHIWKLLIDPEPSPEMDQVDLEKIDAVFVVVNIYDEKNIQGIEKLLAAGFEFQSPYLGAYATRLGYAEEFIMPAGYLKQTPMIPSKEILTYSVPNVLVAHRGISDSTLANLAKVFDKGTRKLQSKDFAFDATDASEMLQGLDAFLGVLINIFLGFLALLGLEMWIYRKRFHELNSLVSLLSMLQSNKDILGESNLARRIENLKYLSLVSDLLSIISSINGFYTQENSSLLFNNQSEVIHQRCDNLKLNIQLKILHAGIELPKDSPSPIKPQPEQLGKNS